MTPSADGIDRFGSRAVLIGVSRYRDPAFPPIEGAEKSLLGLQRMLVDEELGGWPYDRVTTMLDPVDSRRVISILRRLAQDTRGVLLVYFVGHGTITAGGDLALAVTDTVADEPDVTGLEYSKIRSALLESPANVKAVVLDCCYSGRAINALAGDGQYLADATDIRGTYTLTAADHIAHAGHPGACTAFTGELLDLISTGIAGGPAVLTFAELYPHLRHRLIARNLPHPNQRGTDTADKCPVAKNVYGTATTASAAENQPPRAPFEMTWTGREPLSSYTRRIHQTSWRTWAISSAVLAAASSLLGAFVIPASFKLGVGERIRQDTAELLLGNLLLGFAAICLAIGAAMTKDMANRAERLEIRRGWSLHVGPYSIMTVDTTGFRERIWAQIQRVTIEEIQGIGPYRYIGIHVEYTESSPPRTAHQLIQQPVPAGWPYPHQYFRRNSIKTRGPRFPICVLGPMTDEQRAELTDALTRYGGQRWEAPAT